MLIDTHCHLTSAPLSDQFDDVVARAHDAGVTRMITVATDPADARRAVPLLQRCERLFLAAGIHPHEAAKVDDSHLAELSELHRGCALPTECADRLAAVGETGLDYHYDFATPDQQRKIFRAQLELAVAVNRPVIVHAREAEDEVCEILAGFPALRDRVVFHCYSGPADTAQRIVDEGYWISFTGMLTFKNADEVREAARRVPFDRVMVETDAPYLSPEPMRKQRPCEPALVMHTARALAAVHGVTLEELAKQTTANAERFFGLPVEQP